MKRKIFISFVAVALMAVTAAFFTACSQDEAEEDAVQSKVELLKAKAKEFSQKYGMEMSLNEDNIEEVAETLTVEQLEKDFQKISSMKMHITIPPKEEVTTGKRLKIKKAKTIEEERETDYSGNFEEDQIVDITYAVDGKIYTASYDTKILVWWTYQFKSNVSMGISFELKGSPEASAYASLQPSFSTVSGRFSFMASGIAFFHILSYTASKACVVNYEDGGQKYVSIG